MYIEKPSGGTFQMTPAGNHVAVCTRFIDLGSQLSEYKGVSKVKRKVLVTWELPNELMTEGEYVGQPFTIGKKYTWSMHEKAELRHDLEGWRNKAFTDDDFDGPNRFNVKNIIGKGCMLNVGHDTKEGKTYANIKAVASLPKGMPAPESASAQVYFSLHKDFFDNGVLDGLSEKLKETIKSSPEYRELVDGYSPPVGTPTDNGLDDEVPF